MPTAVIYARVSSAGERQRTERQVKDLTGYAHAMEYELIRVFEEHVSGAKKNKERPVLQSCIEFCKQQHIGMLLVSEMSRLGRNALEVLAIVRELQDHDINLHLQKEQFTLLDAEGHPSLFAPIMLATLSTCAEMERESITFRLNSGRKRYVESGGKLGRPAGSAETQQTFLAKHRNVVKELKAGTSIRRTAKLCDCSQSTVQRVKKLLEQSHNRIKI